MMTAEELRRVAKNIRRDIIEMCYHAQSGHEGGSLSIADILSVLYFDVMKIEPCAPHMASRDRLVLSKGHTAPALYAALAEAGFFHKDWLFHSFRIVNGRLQGHPDMKKTPGVDMSTGSLGMGLSAALGMALACRFQKMDYHVFCIMGDGEMNEGQIWEAAATAAAYQVKNLIGIVDMNGLQNDGSTDEVKNMLSLRKKWESFGWTVYETDGHDIPAIRNTFQRTMELQQRPCVILMHTVKGKGVSYMENKVEWHAKAMNDSEYRQALDELS